jgi:glycosyltransferase involved in cell wall biosynthesis
MTEDGLLVISPCRDESQYMRQTLDTMVSQTRKPDLWLIVDDGSTDETPEILKAYAAQHDWIQIITRENRGKRAVGPGVIDAFYAGYNAVDADKYAFVCKLDLDLRLPERYFEILLQRMQDNPNIGTCSGKAYIETPHGLENERHGDETSLGMTKLYRHSCFKKIGGFVREVMWDGIDCHTCRMHGWIACSWDEPGLRFVHLRPMGSSQVGIHTGRMRHGYGQYYMGTSFLFMLASAVYRLNEKPYITGSAAILWGWLRAALTAKPRYQNKEFRQFLRKYQMRALLHGKQKAVEMTHKEKGIHV